MAANKDNKSPYDDSLWDRWIIYDDIIYTRDPDLCCDIILSSGNIIKSYRCLTDEPYILNN